MKISAGLLLYKLEHGEAYFFLVHPGGPFFARKDKGWWTIPKGELQQNESLLKCAVREFEEETGYKPQGHFFHLGEIVQKGGKQVHAWLCSGNLDAEAIHCNTFELEWPPQSGIKQAFPEIDRAAWFSYDEALKFINERQKAFLNEAVAVLKSQH